MRLAFIGIGNVGFALANNLQKHGHEIIVATNNSNSESVLNALDKNSNFTVMNIQDAVDNAEVVFLATPYHVNKTVL